jgi:hypothetical protein
MAQWGRMRTPSLPVLGLALGALAGGAAAFASPQSTPSARLQVRGCLSLTVADVSRVVRISVKKQDLAPPDRQIRCSSVFFGGLGDVVVVIAERLGGGKTLDRLRRIQAGETGAAALQSVVGLGTDAFVFRRRLLAFRRGTRVVTLETGYSTSGHEPVLSVAQLERLGRIVLRHLKSAA